VLEGGEERVQFRQRRAVGGLQLLHSGDPAGLSAVGINPLRLDSGRESERFWQLT
jgi:hypothetical protein